MNRGLFRSFVVFTVGWLGWFGYQAYDANWQINVADGAIGIVRLQLQAGRTPTYSENEIVQWKYEQTRRFNRAIDWGGVGAAIGFVVWLAAMWIVRGFRPAEATAQTPYLDKRLKDIEQAKVPKAKGSTGLLVLSIVFFPLAWLIDPGAMANFWIARRSKDK